ncbi:transaldolase family protein [Escherichia coli]
MPPPILRCYSKLPGLSQYEHLIDDAIAWGKKNGRPRNNRWSQRVTQLAVNVGAEILKIVPGRVSTEVDARLSLIKKRVLRRRAIWWNFISNKALRNRRIVIELALTWEGISRGRRAGKRRY